MPYEGNRFEPSRKVREPSSVTEGITGFHAGVFVAFTIGVVKTLLRARGLLHSVEPICLGIYQPHLATVQ